MCTVAVEMLAVTFALRVFECLQKLCIMENERTLLEYEKKDLEKKLADQKTDSELLRGQLRVCSSVLDFQQSPRTRVYTTPHCCNVCFRLHWLLSIM